MHAATFSKNNHPTYLTSLKPNPLFAPPPSLPLSLSLSLSLSTKVSHPLNPLTVEFIRQWPHAGIIWIFLQVSHPASIIHREQGFRGILLVAKLFFALLIGIDFCSL